MFCFFFFNDTATTEIYTLSLHDALPISTLAHRLEAELRKERPMREENRVTEPKDWGDTVMRSEEHTSELQSHSDLVCRLLLEKKKKKKQIKNENKKKTKVRSDDRIHERS